MKIRTALAALAVATVLAQASTASAGPVNQQIRYGHAPAWLKVAAIVTMISSASVVFNAICVSAKQNRQLTQQEAYLAAALPFAWVILNQPQQRALRRR
jgi:hypothetical protein